MWSLACGYSISESGGEVVVERVALLRPHIERGGHVAAVDVLYELLSDERGDLLGFDLLIIASYKPVYELVRHPPHLHQLSTGVGRFVKIANHIVQAYHRRPEHGEDSLLHLQASHLGLGFWFQKGLALRSTLCSALLIGTLRSPDWSRYGPV